MKIDNVPAEAMPLCEVLKVLGETREREMARPRRQQHIPLNTVVHEAIQYIKKTPSAKSTLPTLLNVKEKLKPFKLTNLELLQVCDLRATTETEMQLIIENCEERLQTEEQLTAVARAAEAGFRGRFECTAKEDGAKTEQELAAAAPAADADSDEKNKQIDEVDVVEHSDKAMADAESEKATDNTLVNDANTKTDEATNE